MKYDLKFITKYGSPDMSLFMHHLSFSPTQRQDSFADDIQI